MILVTGGTGLVGAHLLLHLIENGEKVRSTYRNLESIQKTKALFELYKKPNLFGTIEWIQADILDIPSLEIAFTDIQFVYHCAAFISFDPKEEDIVRKTNIEGTANVVNFCLVKNIKKLCFVSSIAALGDLLEHQTTITEDTEWNPEKPHSDYAISKYGAEMEIWRGQQEGLNVVIVNPGIILGPGFWDQGSGAIFKTVKKGLPFYTKGSTGFVAVSDLVVIMSALMKSKIQGERFTIIAQNSVFRDLTNTIADCLHVKRANWHANPTLINVFWRIDWLLSNVLWQKRKLSKATAKATYSVKLYSNTKIVNALKYNFIDIHDYIKAISSL